jgi:hypothetical protein
LAFCPRFLAQVHPERVKPTSQESPQQEAEE